MALCYGLAPLMASDGTEQAGGKAVHAGHQSKMYNNKQLTNYY